MTSNSESEELLGRRLHGLSPVFQIGRSFVTLVVPGLIFIVFASGDSYSAWYMIAFLPAVSASLFRYFTLRYDLSDEYIIVREGLFFRSVRHIPFSRIQNIDTTQSPLHRLFGVAEVRLETAGGREPEAVFRVLSSASLDVIRSSVFASRELQSSQSKETDQKNTVPFFCMEASDIAVFGLLSQKGMALLAGLLFLLWEFDLWARLENALPFDPEEASKTLPIWAWVLVVVVLFMLLQVLTIIWAFLTLQGFQITRSQDGLSTQCGLWTRQSVTLPRHRIHFLSVQQGVLSRLFGRVSIQAMTAGGLMDGEEQISRKWLIPLMGKQRLGGILQEVQPGLELGHVNWLPVHAGAFKRMLKRWLVLNLLPCGILAYQMPLLGGALYVLFGVLGFVGLRFRARFLGYALSRNSILVRDGMLTQARNAVRFSKIQSISVKQSPFDRRHGTATLEVDTAGQNSSGLRLRIPYLALGVAEALKNQLRSAAAGASFQW